MSPIEIAEVEHKHSENQPNTSTSSAEEQKQQQSQQEENKRAEEDINNNDSNHRKRSCSSTSSLATEKRRSARLLKKHTEEEQQHQHDQESRVEFCKKRAASMLSKIKQSTGATAPNSRASSFSHHNNNNNNSSSNNNNNNNNSDTEDNNDLDQNDSNNNQLEAPIQPSKLTQDELMDIVEVSRKRRLSKGSADTLGSFIKWSFPIIESSQERRRRDSFSLFEKKHTLVIENNNNVQKIKSLAEDAELLDDEDDWSTLSSRNQAGKLPTTEQLLRQHAKLSAVAQCGGSSAANLALLRHQSSLIAAQEAGTRLIKRPRTHMYSPESKQRLGSPTGERRKVSGYLGNVVERLHRQQQQKPAPNVQQEADSSEREQESNSGLSYHLQQFLSQQTSLEDLCSSVGLDDSNQLVLAAAIHRALVDSVGSSGGQANEGVGSKSTASSTGGSSIGSSSNSAGGAASATLHQVDSLTGRRRTYNTRGGGGGLAAGLGASALGQVQQSTTRQHSSSTAATLAALNINSRVQQQRHAQAAAALSALANAGSQHNHQSHNHSGHQVASSTPISQFPLSNLSAGMSAQSAAGGQSLNTGSATTNGAGGNPMVDFECETCGSSFDDRHRLMQHQSIHLELKKDWFTETPVDEVMKIFNRRRGEFLCNTCNLRFEATFDYDKHNHQVHGQRPYCCQFCGNGTRTFRFWRQYLNHLYDHRYIFSCTIEDCDFTVNRRDSLRFHIFRFHLNCQLPQQQTHIRSAGHQHNMMLGANDSGKWPLSMGVHHDGVDEDVDDLDRDSEMNIGD